MKIDRWMAAAAFVAGSVFVPTLAAADPNTATTIGTSLPADFPSIRNPYLRKAVDASRRDLYVRATAETSR